MPKRSNLEGCGDWSNRENKRGMEKPSDKQKPVFGGRRKLFAISNNDLYNNMPGQQLTLILREDGGSFDYVP